MYSFAQRDDTQVVDEPLYAHYLANIDPKAYRPYRAEVLAAQNANGNRIMQNFAERYIGSQDTPIFFLKHMAKQSKLLDLSFLKKTQNVILIRHPAEVLSSWSAALGVSNTRLEDIGLAEQRDLVEAIMAAGQEPIIVSHESLISRPEGTLRALCEALGLCFTPAMLKWSKGGCEEDGLWAKYWYHNSHASTGFMPELQTNRVSSLKFKLPTELQVMPEPHPTSIPSNPALMTDPQRPLQ